MGKVVEMEVGQQLLLVLQQVVSQHLQPTRKSEKNNPWKTFCCLQEMKRRRTP